MMPAPLGIIGLGVIGGSLARALRDDPAWRTIGWSPSEDERAAAARAGIATGASLDQAARAARDDGIVVLAVPLDRVAETARAVRRVAPDALVLHTASLQRPDAVRLAPSDQEHVFGAHPIAGTHRTGFAASRADLFQGATVSIETRLADADRDRAIALWRAAGVARVAVRDADAHDALMAWVSHLPQLAATAAAAALEAGGVPPDACGPGARDTTRLAQSPIEMWRPLLERAPAETVAAVRAMREALADLERSITDRDLTLLERRWRAARRWRTAATAEPS